MKVFTRKIVSALFVFAALWTWNPQAANAQCTGFTTDFPYEEGWEMNGFGEWTNSTSDDFDWFIHSGETSSGNTGPDIANEDSLYAYTETSGQGTNDEAILEGPCLTFGAGTVPYMKFSYHMFGGANIGTLELEVNTNPLFSNTWTSIWSISGNQGNNWIDEEVDLSAYANSTIKLRFVGTTGGTNFQIFRGDRAIDNLVIHEGIDITHVTCNGGADGAVAAEVAYGTAPYTYSWNTGASGQTLVNLSAGTYTVTITDNTGSTRTASAIVTEPSVPTPGAISASSSSICQGSGTSVTLTVPQITSTSTYNSTTAQDGVAGNGGNITFQFTGVSAPPTGDATLTCFYRGDLDGGGGQPDEFVHFVDEAGDTLVVSQPTPGQCDPSYSFVSVTIPADSIVAWGADGTIQIVGDATADVGPFCSGFGWEGFLTLTYPTNPYEPYWFSGTCTTSVSAAIDSGYSINVNPTATTTYMVSFYDATCNSWTSCSNTTITVNPQPTVSVNPPSPTVCIGNSVVMTASGASTYSWSPGTGLSATTGSTVTLTPTGAVTYTVIGTDANGCTNSVQFTSSIAPNISSSISSTNPSCAGQATGSATATGIGGTTPYTYTWSNGGSSTTESNLAAGTYTVTVSDANGCSSTSSAVITDPAGITVTLSATNVNCFGQTTGSVFAAASGGTAPYTYNWSNGGSGIIISNVSAGTYTVTVTDNNGCSATNSSTVTQPSSALVGAISSSTNVSCFGGSDGSATVTASGGTPPYTYVWSNGGTTATISNLPAGFYLVNSIIDANGCSTFGGFIQITQPLTAVTSSITATTDVSCFGGSDGTATVTASGGTGSLTYAWSTGGTAASETGMPAGTHTVTVTDANGCTDTSQAVINQPTGMSPVTSTTPVSCNGDSDGSASVSVTGGTSPYTYLWSTGGTSTSISSLAAATYTVTITDNNGCTITETATVTEPALLFTTILAFTDVSCNGGSDGSLTAAGSGGTTAYTYNWSNGGSGSVITGLAAATYTVTLTDANGCTATTTGSVSEPPLLTATISSTTDVSCNGGSDGAATVTGGGGTPSYTYTWSSGASTASATNLSAGTYTVTITDANNCTATASTTISEPLPLSATITSTTNVSCNGGSDGAASVAGSGGTSPYTFVWSTGGTSSSVTGLSAGTHTVTITDANACTTTTTATITEPTALSTSTSTTMASCNGVADGTATVSASGGTPSYTYLWSSGATTATATGLAAGTYTVTVTDNNGCTTTDNATVAEPTVVVAGILTTTNVSCNGDSDGAATAGASGGTAPYTFLWNTGGTTSSVTGLSAGTYTVTVTDNNGCTDATTATITEPTVLTATMSGTVDVSCNGDSDGSATVTAAGGTSPYTYSWSNAQNMATASNLAAGTYTVTVSDANNCTATVSATITEPTALTLSVISTTDVSCNGGNDGAASVAGSGGTSPYTFSWSTGASTSSATGLSAGTYTVTMTDNNGCTITTTATITEPAALTTSTSATSASCNGASDGTATVVASGGTPSYTYAWSSGATTATATGLAAGTYTVTVTDANGCTTTNTATVTEPVVVTASILTSTNVSCNGGSDGSATAAAAGGTSPYTFTWSNAGSTSSISGLSAGAYTVTVTDNNGCSDVANVTITEPVMLTASVSSSTNVSCNGGNDGSATVTAAGGTPTYTYAWSDGQTTATASNLAAGTYTVTVTDANNCTATASATLTEPTAVNVSLIASTDVSCNGGNDGSASVAGSGGTSPYTFVWSSGATTSSATGLSAGTYTVTLTDANGCTTTTTATISEPAALTASTSTTAASCNGFADGSATVTASGGTPSYTYSWSTGGTTASISSLGAGTYTVTVTDANGCTTTATATVAQPTAVTAAILTSTDVSCNGGSDGSAVAGAAGGTSPYTFTWSNGATTSTATGLAAGTYTVTVTDNNGCIGTTSATITEPTALTGTISSTTDVSCNGGNDGAATVTAAGGTPTYTYSWSNGATTASASGLSAGTHTVTISDANGCTTTATATITEPTAVVASVISTTDVSCNGGSDGSAAAGGSGGTSPYTFAWSSGASTSSATGLSAGTYTVTLTDANGCTATASATISEPAALTTTTSTTSASCNGVADGTATVSASGGTPSYTYSWSSGATTATASGLAAGTYTVTVTDANGCTTTNTATVTEPVAVSAAILTATNVSCNGGADGSATAAAAGGTAPYTFTWSSGASTSSITGLSAGTYTVTVTDNNGCTDQASATITEPTALSASISTSSNVSCNGGTDGSATVLASGGTPNYTYVWSDGQSTATASNLGAGTYTVTVTDFNNCTATTSVTITEPTAVLVTIIASTDVSCNGGSDGSASAAGGGGTSPYTFAWSSGASGSSASGLSAGTYTVTLTDANGCTVTTTVTITEPAALTATTATTDASCNGFSDGTATATASGGTPSYTYVWSSGSTTATATGLLAGTYTVTISDANGCTTTSTATVNEPTSVSAGILLSTNVSCNGGADGTAAAAGAGGTSPYTFTWSSGATTSSISGLSAGSYTVTVTDNNGCSDNTSVTITEPTALSASISSTTDVSCNGGNDGEATAAGSGGTPTYTFLWSDGQTTATASGLMAGTYTVTITDNNGCTATTTATITEPTAVSTAVIATTDVSCNGGNDGSATAAGSGGTSPYTFTWSSGATTSSATGLSAGTYTVTLTDANGCTATASATISEPAALTSTTSTTSASCNGVADGTATVTPSGGTPSYTYSWSSGATTATASGLSAGTYTVTVTDANGCTLTDVATVAEPTPVVAAILTTTDVSCNGGSDGAATAAASGGTSPYTFTWSNGGTSSSVSGLTAGAYTVTVTDNNGCTDVTTATITEPVVLTSTISATTDVSCNGGNDGSATVTAAGGTPTYTYSWSDGQTTATASNLMAGTYTVTVTDANNCTTTATATITEPTPINVSIIASTNVSCNGGADGTASAAGSGGTSPYSFVWSTGASTSSVTGLAAGTYTVTLTDANGCTDTASVTITEPTPLATAMSSTAASCNGAADGTATVVASGGTPSYTYSWSSGATTATATGLMAGTYTVTVTDNNGCTIVDSAIVTEPAPVVAGILTSTNVSCNGGSDGAATAAATGGTTPYTFAWNTGGTTSSITGLSAGTYSVTVTDNNGCTDSTSVTITEPVILTSTISSTTDVSCNGGNDGAATVTAAGGTPSYTYAWSDGQTTATASNLMAGTYTVTVTDANNCTTTATATITEPTLLSASIIATTDVSCNGGSDGTASAAGSGGTSPYTFAWSSGASASSATGLAAGTYTVTVTDANNCMATTIATITEPTALSTTTSVTDASCNGASDGTATVSVSGGTPSYSYLWSDGQTTATATGLMAGTYTVTVTDNNGCTITDNATVSEPALLVAAVISTTDVSCNGGSDGAATAGASGGTSPYTFSWSNAATTSSISGLTAGTYTVTVTDNNGCTDVTSATITEPTLLVASITGSTNVSCSGGNDGTATVGATGGTIAYTYVWSDGQTAATATNLSAGTYTATVTDANGCTDQASVTITEPTAVMVMSIVDSNVTCNGFANGGATVFASGGTGAYTYIWSNSGTTASITGVVAGTYSVTVTDANGCTDSSSITITEPLLMTVAAVVDSNVSCNGFLDGGASASGAGGTGAYTFLWSNGTTTASITGVGAGTYSVTMTDANGCTDSTSVTITEPVTLVASTVVDSNASCNGFSDGGVTASATGGTMPYTYNWNTGASMASMTGIPAGTYSVTITDANGCTDSSAVTVTEPAVLVATANAVSNVSCFGLSDGVAESIPTGGTAPYTYSWSSGGAASTETGLAAGTYMVTVTDNNGCTDQASVTITEPTLLMATATVDSNVTCNGLSDGGASVVASGGTAPYTYLWSNSGTTASITGVVAGTYTVTVTDNNGCTATSSATIIEPALLVGATTIDNNVSCNGLSDGQATASATGGTSPYTYNWSTGAAMATAMNLAAGTYTVTVSDANGCTDVTNATITEPTVLNASATVINDVSCNGLSDGSAQASGSGGTSPYTYLWSSGATSSSATGLAAGTYTVTVTDANGCTDQANVTITEPAVLVATTVVDSNVSCNGFLDGGATAFGTGGTPVYSYSWSNGATTASITGVAAGTYSVTLTDANGCTDSTTVTITEPVTLVASTVVDSNASCFGFADGGATASAAGGTMPYSYLWSNGGSTASITGVVAGTYTVTVTDNNGCTDTSSVTIVEPALLVATTVVDSNVSCNGLSDGGATASSTGGTMPYTYVWSNSAATASITGVMAGTYSVTVTDANGCTDSTTVTITEPVVLVASAVVDNNVSCNGLSDGEASASGSGGTMPYTYNWSNGASTNTAIGLAAGSYTVTVTDNNGCTDQASVTITEPTLLTISITGSTDVLCNGDSTGTATTFTNGGTSPYTYAWSTGETGADENSLAAGTHTVTVTDNNGCTALTSVTIAEPTVLVAVATVDSNVTCNGLSDGGATASVSGGTSPYTYSWSNAATTASITGVLAGTYTVTVTDANGCTDTASVTITEPALLVAATVVDSNVSCFGLSDGGATASGAGGTTPYAYLWSTGGTGASITGVPAGTYSVTLTDINGCTDSTSVVITEPMLLAVSAVVDSQVTCFGFADGGGTAFPTGGTAPYTYNWSNGGTTVSITGLVAGNYTVTVTDNNGCTAFTTITVFEPTPLVAAAVVDSNVTCNGLTNGGATASASGGTSPYTYSWSNGASSASITGVGAGTYTVMVTDNNGCTDTASVTITQPALLVATAIVDSNVTCNGFTDGGASAAATGGTMPYTYTWSNGGLSASLTGLPAGTYTVTISDVNGCTDSTSVVISQPAALGLTMTSTNVSCNAGSDGTAKATVSGGVTPYTYSWSNAATTDSIGGLVAGTYTVTVTDANGCTILDSAVITEPVLLVASINGTLDVLCNGDANGAALVGATGGTSPYTFNWPSGATTPLDTGLTAGTYVATVTDANGCTDTAVAVITEPQPLTNAFTIVPVFCVGDSTGQATATPAGGTAPYTYAWPSGATTATDTGLVDGSYIVTITDTNGCSILDTAVVNALNQLPVVALGNDTALCDDTLVLDAGAGMTSYLWNTGDTTQTFTVSVTGTYSVEVYDGFCFNSDTINVTVHSLPTVNIGPDTTVCGGITLDAGAGQTSYLWSNTDTTQTSLISTSGVISVTVTDANTCTNTDTAVVTVNPLPVVDLGPDTSVCDGIVLDAGAGQSSYLWNTGDTNQTLLADVTGVYSVTVTDANGCSNLDTTVVTIFPPMVFSALVIDATCTNSDGLAVLSVAGGSGVGTFTYQWSTGSIDSAIIGVPAGTYSVTVTDGNGCAKDTAITIINSNAQLASVTGSDLSCFNSNDGSATVNLMGGTAPFTYAWNNGGTTASITNQPAGIYIIDVTDANGCFTTDTITLNEPPQIVASVSTVDATCGVGDGEATVVASGGVGPLSYTWDDPLNQNTATADSLFAGLYNVTITDSTGCFITETAGVSNVGAPTLSISGTDVTCTGGSDGQAVIAATGTGPFTYAWNDPASQSTDTAFTLTAGTYFVVVTDGTGCIGTDSITLGTLFGLPTVSLGNDTAICTGDAITLDPGVFAGYEWQDGSTNQTLNATVAGSYWVTVTDANTCQNSDTVEITNLALPVVNIGPDTTVCGGIVLNAGTGFTSYVWNNGDTTQAILASQFGNNDYSVTVTDANTCSNSDTAAVNVLPNPIVDIGPAVDTLCEPFTYDIDAGGGFDSYLWSTGDTSQVITVSSGGTYWCVVSDFNGCLGADTIILVGDPCTTVPGIETPVAIRYYPNPTDGYLNLEATGLEGEDVTISVVSLDGRMIFQQQVPNLPQEFRMVLDLNEQAQGLYFVRITTPDRAFVNRISVK